MSFRTNSYQQLSLTDSIGGLTTREQKALERSWAKVFAEDIFQAVKNNHSATKHFPDSANAVMIMNLSMASTCFMTALQDLVAK